ncbi:MAG: hypothetical protein WA432_01645 [Candidatus Babeliaceae bacterium]
MKLRFYSIMLGLLSFFTLTQAAFGDIVNDVTDVAAGTVEGAGDIAASTVAGAGEIAGGAVRTVEAPFYRRYRSDDESRAFSPRRYPRRNTFPVNHRYSNEQTDEQTDGYRTQKPVTMREEGEMNILPYGPVNENVNLEGNP